MKRGMTIVTVAALVLAACGGGDDSDDGAADVPAPSEESDDSATRPADDTDEPDAGDGPADDATEPAESESESGDSEVVPPGLVINSFGDIPEVCRESMAQFLRDIEPIVSGVDWQTATMADLQGLGEQFEAISDEFEAREDENGCGDLEFADDGEFEILIDFAGDVAPGTAGFLGFLDAFGAFTDDDDDTADETPIPVDIAGDTFEDCDEAITWVEELMAEYDTMREVPIGELARLAQLGLVAMTCTPAQLEFFDSPEVSDFLDS